MSRCRTTIAGDSRSEIWSTSLIKIKGAVNLLVAVAFFGACRIVPTQTVPPNINDQFAKVAQELRSFPPGFVFGSDYMESPNNVPGAAEYEALIQSNQAVSALLALLKDRATGDEKKVA